MKFFSKLLFGWDHVQRGAVYSGKFQPVATFDYFNGLYHGIATSNVDMEPDKNAAIEP